MSIVNYHLYRFSQTDPGLVWGHYLSHFEASDRDSFLIAALDAFCCPYVRPFEGKGKKAKHWRRKDMIRLQVAMNDRGSNWYTLTSFFPSCTPTMIGEYIEDHLTELYPQGIEFQKCDNCGLSLTDGYHILHCVLNPGG